MPEIYATTKDHVIDVNIVWNKTNSVRIEYDGRVITLGFMDAACITTAGQVVRVPVSREVEATVAAVVALGGFV